ncbi:hypothetical protein NMY22_g14813 [Coprinellus aureogranulatus]|nr:hypothetical protein NMY22_g14813 [Coprinellus aureogranulatus]
MAYLTKPTVYNIEDTNIALLGSDLEKHVRENAGEGEPAWESAGQEEGLKIWRVEQFHIVEWPKDRYGSFYDGDSYIVLYTYKVSPEATSLSHNLHFWLGQNTTVDEAGTAAYKTVELDDHLHGKPVQFREVQGFESTQFLSYFPRFTSLKGGVCTGFHHVTAPPPEEVFKLYRVTLSRFPGARTSTLVVREVEPISASLVAGDAYVLDKGTEVWQLNTKQSVGQEKYKAAEFAQSLVAERKGCEVTVFGECLARVRTSAKDSLLTSTSDEGTSGVNKFLSAFGEGTTLIPQEAPEVHDVKLFRLSDASGHVTFEQLPGVSRDALSSDDVFLLDDSKDNERPALYVWIGQRSSLKERRSIVQVAQQYLYKERESHRGRLGVPIIKMEEGNEVKGFFEVFEEA